MKVVKRDGRVVDYNRNKILIAVRKANAEVDPFERVSEDDIDGIIASVEGENRETIRTETDGSGEIYFGEDLYYLPLYS